LLQLPGKAVAEKYFREKCIEFRDKETSTTTFPVYVNGESFDVTYTVSLSDYSTETGMVPDLRKNIHSALQFHLVNPIFSRLKRHIRADKVSI